ESSCIESSVVVGITRKDKAMGKCLCFLGLSLGHARVPRITNDEAGRSPELASKLITPRRSQQLPWPRGGRGRNEEDPGLFIKRKAKTLRWRVIFDVVDCAGRNRTYDLQVMSLAS